MELTICKSQFRKEVLTTISGPKHRCKSQCMSPQNGKVYSTYIEFIKLKEGRRKVVICYEFVIALNALESFAPLVAHSHIIAGLCSCRIGKCAVLPFIVAIARDLI